MKGHISGVSTQLLLEEPRAIYTHCYSHSLNLACQDTIRSIRVLKDALDTTFELSKLLKYSSKRKATYKQIKKNKLLLLILDFVHSVQHDGQSEQTLLQVFYPTILCYNPAWTPFLTWLTEIWKFLLK